MRFIEVSHKIEAGMRTYPGLPVPREEVILDYEASHERFGGLSEFYIASLHLCGNTGTYVDSPIHRYRHGADLSELPLERLAHVPVTLIDVRNSGRAIGREAFLGRDIRDKAVLVLTGFSAYWRTDRYLEQNPFLTADACDFLLDQGVRFAGIDSLNIDDINDLSRPAHTKLLGAGVPVCEHMTNLDAVAGSTTDSEGWRIHAVPIAWAGGATFPVRAYLLRDEEK